MPRDPLNNPTERILRMIAEWQETVEWIESFELPPRPKTPALDEEILRQRLTKAHTESQRDYRLRMHLIQQRAMRHQVRALAADHGMPGVQSAKRFHQGLEDQLRSEGETIPHIPAPQPRQSKVDKAVFDEVMQSLKTIDKYDAMRAAASETLSPEDVARSDMEKAQAFAEKAKSGLFGPKPEEDNG